MFITEKEMFELKYQSNSEYSDMCLAKIFLLEYHKVKDKFNFFNEIRYFYHLYSENEAQCSVKFIDNSILLLEKDSNEKWSSASIHHPNYIHISSKYSVSFD